DRRLDGGSQPCRVGWTGASMGRGRRSAGARRGRRSGTGAQSGARRRTRSGTQRGCGAGATARDAGGELMRVGPPKQRDAGEERRGAWSRRSSEMWERRGEKRRGRKGSMRIQRWGQKRFSKRNINLHREAYRFVPSRNAGKAIHPANKRHGVHPDTSLVEGVQSQDNLVEKLAAVPEVILSPSKKSKRRGSDIIQHALERAEKIKADRNLENQKAKEDQLEDIFLLQQLCSEIMDETWLRKYGPPQMKGETDLLTPGEIDIRYVWRNRLACLLREEEIKWYRRAKTKDILEVAINIIIGVAQKVISPTQTAFIPGRNIIERVVILYETIHEIHRKNKSGVILKIDCEKAYDKLGNFPVRYLGIPMHFRILSYKDRKTIEGRIEKKLSSWKGDEHKNKYRLNPKIKGTLGVHNLEIQNQCLLSKWLFRLINE
uniref:Reverse transcriptase domain-containing protein n=1 Tax=Oryza glaberrima TaxID=4538 RepID=I1QM68_ORYGL